MHASRSQRRRAKSVGSLLTRSLRRQKQHGAAPALMEDFQPSLLEMLESRLLLSTTFIVDNTLDSGVGSLRQAIIDANSTAGVDDIHFNILGSGPHTIAPLTELPEITEGVVIDGYTQAGAQQATASTSAVLKIEIDGVNVTPATGGVHLNGLFITSGNTTIRGLVINSFNADINQDAIFIDGGDNNVIVGNYIGTDITGTIAKANGTGVSLNNSANNIIGGAASADRNVVSGNLSGGIIVTGGILTNAQSNHNVIIGNYVGVDATGAGALGNGSGGVTISGFDNRVGGAAPGEANIVSANGSGITLTGADSSDNIIQGNFVGTDASATQILGNTTDGIALTFVNEQNSPLFGRNIVGGVTPGEGNTVVNSGRDGILMLKSTRATIQGNYVGTTGGNAIMGNGRTGIATGANTLVGGTDPGAGNVVANNQTQGITVGDDNVTVQGNFIGTNRAANIVMGNKEDGILVSGTGNIIGGAAAGAGNVIAGNGVNGTSGLTVGNGILLLNNPAVVQGNFIGTDPTGTINLGNVGHGIRVVGNGSMIGGASTAEGNTIAFNTHAGIAHEFQGVNNSYLSNRIYNNGQLGIDISASFVDGVTPNDLGDADAGSNNLQNHPVLIDVTGGASSSITGTLNSTANTTFTIQFFANSAADPSGFGEGEIFLGSGTATTDATGNVNFTITVAGSVPAGHVVTATATDPNGNTSEFSGEVAPSNAAPTADAGGPYTVAEGGSVLLDATASSDPDQASTTLIYEWDLDGDNVFGETGAAAGLGDEVGANPTLLAATLDGPSSLTVQLRVTDDGGLSDTTSATVSVTNVAPTIDSITGPSSSFRNDPVIFSGAFSDQATADTHTQAWEVHDAANTLVASGAGAALTFTPIVFGQLTVTYTVTDDDGGADSSSVTLDVVNRTPTAHAGGPYTVAEGGSVLLDATASSDPDQASTTLIYEWDLDGDNVFGETGAAAGLGDEVGANPTLLAATLDGPSSLTVQLRVTDDGGLSDTTSATVSVTNVAPTIDSITGPNSITRGFEANYVGAFSDPAAADTHTQTWEVRDTANTVIATGAGAGFSFTPTVDGQLTVTYTVTDDDSGVASQSTTLDVSAAAVFIDPLTGQTTLAVGGDSASETIRVGRRNGAVRVIIGNAVIGDFDPAVQRVIINGGDGNDRIAVARNINAAVEINGGQGNDLIVGGNGDDIIRGGAGNDIMLGRNGRDLLLGGEGSDIILGQNQDDILIAGVYSQRNNRSAMLAVLTEWTRTDINYLSRVANLQNGTGLNGSFVLDATTVFDDGVFDIVLGMRGLDFFLVNDAQDITDDRRREVLTDTDNLFIEAE